MIRSGVASLVMVPFGAFDSGKRVLGHAVAVVALATICRFMAYAATECYAAIFHLKDIDSRRIAEHTFHVAGSLGIIVALVHLTLT